MKQFLAIYFAIVIPFVFIVVEVVLSACDLRKKPTSSNKEDDSQSG